jgi:hypothetical protein
MFLCQNTPLFPPPTPLPSPFPLSPFALGPEIAECVEAALEKLRVPIVWERFPHIHGAKNGLPVEDVDEDLVESIKRNRVCFKGKRRGERERERGERGGERERGDRGRERERGDRGAVQRTAGKLTLLPPPPSPCRHPVHPAQRHQHVHPVLQRAPAQGAGPAHQPGAGERERRERDGKEEGASRA